MRKMLRSLHKVQTNGGCRLEATVQYPSLWEAVQWISKTMLLHPRAYTNPPSEDFINHKMDFMVINLPTILQHAEVVLAKAQQTNLLHGRDRSQASRALREVIRDSLNAMGWANIKIRPTAWSDEDAWWKQDMDQPPEQPTNRSASPVQRPAAILTVWTVEEAKKFYLDNRQILPCPTCLATQSTSTTGGRRQFRIYCKSCQTSTNKGDCTAFWTNLFLQGNLAVPSTSFPVEPQAASEHSASPETRITPEVAQPLPLMPPPVPNPHSPRTSRRSKRLFRELTPEEPHSPSEEDPDSPDGSQYSQPSFSSSEEEYEQPPIQPPKRRRTTGGQSDRPAASPQPEEEEPPVQPPKPRRRRTTGGHSQRLADSSEEEDDYQPPKRRRTTGGQPLVWEAGRRTSFTTIELPSGGTAEVPLAPAFITAKGIYRPSRGFVPPDGNCQFTAIGFHIFGNLQSASAVRRRSVGYMRRHRRLITDFAAQGDGHMGANSWLTSMSKGGQWGDQLSLLAAAEVYSQPLAVASLLPTGDIHWTYYPSEGLPEESYKLLYHSGNHYEIMVEA